MLNALKNLPRTVWLIGLISMVNDITERKQAEEKIRQHMEKLAALRMIDSAISSTLDLPTTLNVLLEQTVRRLKAAAACVLLFTPSRQTLEYAAGLGFRTERITSATVRLGEGYAGGVARERSTRVIADLTVNDGTQAPLSLIEPEGFRAYIGVPLIAKDQVKGVLEVFHRTPFAPDPEWLEFAEALAGQAAIAIDNADKITLPGMLVGLTLAPFFMTPLSDPLPFNLDALLPHAGGSCQGRIARGRRSAAGAATHLSRCRRPMEQ